MNDVSVFRSTFDSSLSKFVELYPMPPNVRCFASFSILFGAFSTTRFSQLY